MALSTIPTNQCHFHRSIEETSNVSIQIPPSNFTHKKEVDFIQVFENDTEFDDGIKTKEARLKVGNNAIPIFVFLHDYTGISGHIASTGNYQTQYGMFDVFEQWLAKYPDLNFIDIGAHLGTESLYFAAHGRKVVAVEPILSHVRRLRKSVVKNNFVDRVKILHNSIGIQAGVLMKVQLQGPMAETDTWPYSIQLSDLLKVITFGSAIFKIDVDGHEAQAFKSAGDLFDKIDVPLIIMETGGLQSDVNFIWNMLIDKGYEPFSTNKPHIPLRYLWGTKFPNVDFPHDTAWVKLNRKDGMKNFWFVDNLYDPNIVNFEKFKFPLPYKFI